MFRGDERWISVNVRVLREARERERERERERNGSGDRGLCGEQQCEQIGGWRPDPRQQSANSTKNTVRLGRSGGVFLSFFFFSSF